MHKVLVRGCGWLVATGLFLLSLWIVLPPLNFFWLQFAVAVPEISPLLAFLSIVFLCLAIFLFRFQYRQLSLFFIVLLTISFVLSSWPLIQLPNTVRQAEHSMTAAFNTSSDSSSVAFKGWSSSWASVFSSFRPSLSTADVRHQAKIPFALPGQVSDQPPGQLSGQSSDQPSDQLSGLLPERPLTTSLTPDLPTTQLALDVYQPPMAGRYPALVILYGGGWGRGDSSENEAFARYFAARGYVVVAIAYRLAPQYRFPVQSEDVRQALAFVREHADEYEIARDSDGTPQLSLVGWSAGAHLAMLEGFQPSEGQDLDAVKSIINFYGPVDLAAGYANPPVPDPLDVRQVLEAFLGGTPSERPQAYAEASPITYVKSAQPDSLPPVLLIYGGRDHIVEAKYGEFLYQQLLASKNTAVWIRIPWAEHAFDKVFSGLSNRVALHFVEQFLAKTLR
ncbi:MAG: alpha/beta hydrolase [Cyanobacteria bacterium J06621_11]